MIDKGIRYEVQGGVKNYLGKQKEVKAPVKWKSSPNHPETELAYITKKEKDLLIKSDLHGSLKGSVNRGPSGIISLNGWGDASDGFGGGSSSGGGNSGGGNGGGGGGGRQDTESQYGSGSYGSYDPSKNVSTREQQYGGNNDGPTPRDLAMGAGGKQKKGTITDIEELSKATGTDFSGGVLSPDSGQNITKTILDKFTSYRPQVNIPPYMIGAKMFQPFIQKFSDISAEENRGFFADPNYTFDPFGIKISSPKSVIEAGRYQLPGELGAKYGKLGYEDIGQMTEEELDQAYKGYLKARSLNEIDAYGNPLTGDRDRGENNNTSGILENILLDDIINLPTPSPTGFNYVPYSNQVVIAPGSQGLASLIGGGRRKELPQPFRGQTFSEVPEQYKAGFDAYTQENPIGGGGQAMTSVMLPDGNRVMFTNTASAGAFRKYLESIGVLTPTETSDEDSFSQIVI